MRNTDAHLYLHQRGEALGECLLRVLHPAVAAQRLHLTQRCRLATVDNVPQRLRRRLDPEMQLRLHEGNDALVVVHLHHGAATTRIIITTITPP
jgi:hypothetical protein